MRSTAAFVAGFTAMFVALGAGAAWFGNVLLPNRRPLEIAAGVFVILAAITFLGLPLPAYSPRSGGSACGPAGAWRPRA